MMALKVAFAVIWYFRLTFAFSEIYPADNSDSIAAFKVFGNQTDGFTGFANSQQTLFGRESCKEGFNQCGYIGECCTSNPGSNCCGLFCIASQPAGTKCCPGYMCPPEWDCCGTIGNNCSPSDGVCCSSDGRFCPADWSCCGDKGACYPTKDFHCCSNDGNFCPDGYKCVQCSGNSTEICCQGTGGTQIPVYKTSLPKGTSVTSLPIPSVTAQAVSDSSDASITSSGTEASSGASVSLTSANTVQETVPTTTTAGVGSGANTLRIGWMFGLVIGVFVGVMVF